MAAEVSRRRGGPGLLLALPGVALLVVFFALPLLEMGRRSITPTADGYLRLLASPTVQRSLESTFVIAFATVLGCLVLGYPYAYVMAKAPRWLATVLGICVILPFWSSMLVRTFAWLVWLQDNGLVNTLLKALGLIDQPLPLVRNQLGTLIGTVQILLPFMVLALVTTMRRIDPQLTVAARSLGASPARAFRTVFWPLSLQGVYAGCLIVFVTSLGFYLTPAVLGDPGRPMVGQLVVQQVEDLLDFGGGSALGLILLVVTGLVLILGTHRVGLARVLGLETERTP